MISSLTKDNLDLVLEQGLGIVPDIEKILGFRFVDGEIVDGKVIENSSQNPLMSSSDYHQAKGTIRKFFNRSKNHHWYTKEDLPFDADNMTTINRQMEIEDPLADSVLMQRISAPGEELLIFVYFRPRGVYFGQYKSDVVNDSQYKHIIAISYTNALNAVLKAHFDIKEEMKKLSGSIKAYFDTQKDSLKLSASNILELSYFYLSQIKGNNEREVCFSPEAIQKLSGYDGSLLELKQILESAYMASEIVQGTFNLNEKLIIDAAFLNLKTAPRVVNQIEATSDRNSNIRAFLNRLENAGQVTKSKDLKITGKHLGENIQPKSISAAAISDFLHKNKDRLKDELNSQPHRWNIIRKEFNPLIKIVAS